VRNNPFSKRRNLMHTCFIYKGKTLLNNVICVTVNNNKRATILTTLTGKLIRLVKFFSYVRVEW